MKPIRTLLLSLVALGLVSWPMPAGAVVGASTDGDVDAGSIVMVLQRRGSAAGFCSGIVIGPMAVLTAAHCVPQGADVRIHFRDAGRAPVLLPVTRVLRHPGYRADAIAKREKSIDLAARGSAPARAIRVARSSRPMTGRSWRSRSGPAASARHSAAP